MRWTDESKVKAGKAGGIKAVVKAINAHIDSPSVCEAGCGALWNMINGNGKNTDKESECKALQWNGTAENQIKAGAAGGIEAVVKAIKTHINNSSICKLGCGALCNMIKSGKPMNKTQMFQWKLIGYGQMRAGTAGGIEVVVKAISIHIGNADVCFHGCGVLRNTAVNNSKNHW